MDIFIFIFIFATKPLPFSTAQVKSVVKGNIGEIHTCACNVKPRAWYYSHISRGLNLAMWLSPIYNIPEIVAISSK